VKFVRCQCQALAKGTIRIETQALGIGDGEQKEIEGAGVMRELIGTELGGQSQIL
jgi:hypothetical protein